MTNPGDKANYLREIDQLLNKVVGSVAGLEEQGGITPAIRATAAEILSGVPVSIGRHSAPSLGETSMPEQGMEVETATEQADAAKDPDHVSNTRVIGHVAAQPLQPQPFTLRPAVREGRIRLGISKSAAVATTTAKPHEVTGLTWASLPVPEADAPLQEGAIPLDGIPEDLRKLMSETAVKYWRSYTPQVQRIVLRNTAHNNDYTGDIPEIQVPVQVPEKASRFRSLAQAVVRHTPWR